MPAPALPGRRRGRWRRRHSVAALLVGVSLLTACTTPLRGHGDAATSSTPTSSPTVSPTALSPTVELSDCSKLLPVSAADIPSSRLKHLTFTCGKVPVPLDYSNPDAATIQIEVIRIHDDQQRDPLGSLMINPGGPGASGLAFPIELASAISNDILTHFDLIGFDPRGVGLSSPIQCIPNLDKDALVALDADIRTPAGFGAAKAANFQVAQECSQKYGPALADYNTLYTAMDMDRIRQALGDQQLNYLGFSYGTELGAAYAHLYPDKIRVAVLDGAVDPTTNAITTVADQVQGFENAFDEFAADCLTRSACKVLGDPRQVVESLTVTANENPIKSSDPHGTRTADGAIVLTGVLWALYQPREWPALGAALVQATKGDAAGLLALADEYYGRGANGTYSNFLDAITAISCNDSPVGPTDAVIEATATQWAIKYPMFGLWTASSLFSCQSWQPIRHPLPSPTATGSNPILVVGTVGDPATPYEGAVHLAAALQTGRLLTWDGDGHTAYLKSQCIDTAVDSYLVDQVLPEVGTVCPD